MEEKVQQELATLENYEKLCVEALNAFQQNNPHKFNEGEKIKILAQLERMFFTEREFLEESPEDYFDVYEEEND